MNNSRGYYYNFIYHGGERVLHLLHTNVIYTTFGTRSRKRSDNNLKRDLINMHDDVNQTRHTLFSHTVETLCVVLHCVLYSSDDESPLKLVLLSRDDDDDR